MSKGSFEKALKAKGLSKTTMHARVSVVRRYLKTIGKRPKAQAAPLAKA